MQNIAEMPNIRSDNATSQKGMPDGSLTIITMGEVKGIMEHQNANGPSGNWALYIPALRANSMIIVIGTINCCVSDSLSTAAPMAANKEAYSIYPPIKNRIKYISSSTNG